MRPLYSLIVLISVYLSIQAIGLYVGLGLIDKIAAGIIQPAVEHPESAKSSISIFLIILVMTAVLLILMKMGFDFVIKIMLALAMLMGAAITFEAFVGSAGTILALILILIYFKLRENLIVTNITLLLTITGIGAFIGASLAVKPSFALLVILSVYDLVAVFLTKHMVTLAEGAKGKIAFMFLIPLRDKKIGLGTGDLVIPLMFTVSVMRDYALANAVLTALGGLVGVISLFFYILNREKVTLPALPPITAGLILGFFVSLLL